MIEKRPEAHGRSGRGRRVVHAAALLGALAAPHIAAAREPKASDWVARIEKEQSSEAKTLPDFMRVGRPATAPYDFVNFCVRHPEECVPFPGSENERMGRESDDEFRRLELGDTNAEVNALPQLSDLERFGRPEHWTVADEKGGDCEDLAALKKRILQHVRGFRPNNLLMAHVLDEKGQGHLVLVVRMQGGDYVLDNRKGSVALWSEFATTHGYTFLSRQSYLDPRAWVTILPLDDQRRWKK